MYTTRLVVVVALVRRWPPSSAHVECARARAPALARLRTRNRESTRRARGRPLARLPVCLHSPPADRRRAGQMTRRRARGHFLTIGDGDAHVRARALTSPQRCALCMRKFSACSRGERAPLELRLQRAMLKAMLGERKRHCAIPKPNLYDRRLRIVALMRRRLQSDIIESRKAATWRL